MFAHWLSPGGGFIDREYAARKVMKKIIYKSLEDWYEHDPFTHCAAAAYYAIFSLPGLTFIIIATAALFFDQQRVEDVVLGHIQNVLGSEVAQSVDKIIDRTQTGKRDIWAMVAGLGTLLFGATGLFIQLQRSLNNLWEVEIKQSAGFMQFLQDRATSLGVILAIGFLLLTSLAVTALLTILGDWLLTQIPAILLLIIYGINAVVSFVITACLFALIFRILPDARVEWRYALIGGALSALLFIIGEYGLAYYFNIARPQSAFGAAGSIVLLMIWVFYSCMILLIGAAFTKNIAEETQGHETPPSDIAIKKTKKD